MSFKVKGSTIKNSGSASSGGSASRAVPSMGSAHADRMFKNPSKGSRKPNFMGRNVPPNKTGR